MELYGFGFNGCRQIAAEHEDDVVTVPTCIRRAQDIRVLWISWCDALIAVRGEDGAWRVEYLGTGLTDAQKEHVQSCERIKFALTEERELVHFFGTKMQDGLRGYVTYHADLHRNKVVLFATDLETESGVQEMQAYVLQGDIAIRKIEVMSSGKVLVCTASRTLDPSNQCIELENLSHLREYCISQTTTSTQLVSLDLDPEYLFSNSTTAIALDPDGMIFTYTTDPRYPQALGRLYDDTPKFAPIDYLAEMKMSKIASGGYVSAAISSDGEIYLWGQACPDSAGELSVVNREQLERKGGDDVKRPTRLEAWRNENPEFEDDYLNCLLGMIDDREAQMYDVVIGHGHVLVAARSSRESGTRSVFAAGDGRKGQLGFKADEEFAEDFMEVEILRDKQVVQMAAAGWTSFIVIRSASG